MATKKKPTLSKIFFSLLIGIPTMFNFVGKIATLIGLEARLAGKSLVHIIILSVLFAIVCSSTWLCVLAMLFVYFTSLQWSAEFSLFIILILHLFLLLIILLFILKFKKRLLFREMRKRLHHPEEAYEDY